FTYGLTQLALGVLGDKGVSKVVKVAKGVKMSQGMTELPQLFNKGDNLAFSGGGNIRSGFDTPDFRQAEEKLSTHQFAKGNDGSSGDKWVSTPNAIRNVENDILDIMESNNGHLLDKHVGKTNDDLLKRAAQEGVDATTFSDKSTATKAVQANIRRNADDISNWLNDPNSSGIKVITTDHGYSIGQGVAVKNGGSSASKQITYDLTTSKVVLVKDSSMPNGYKIVTGYPTIN
ncbi:RNase A-like domain-containing protein, partial [Bacillus cereus]|uniref:RNase A-like domain-containing protein n=1 Tax=Bacillus cereus TaxID=1396 RepID=UPI00356BF83B